MSVYINFYIFLTKNGRKYLLEIMNRTADDLLWEKGNEQTFLLAMKELTVTESSYISDVFVTFLCNSTQFCL